MHDAQKIMRARMSRRTLFKGAGALGLGATLAQTGLIRLEPNSHASLVRSALAQTESIQDILNITATVESFGVTILGVGLESNAQGNFTPAWTAGEVAIITAARAQEQFHLEFFQSLGGQILVDTFHIPDPAILTDHDTFFATVRDQEERETAAQIAAFNTFTAMGRPDLVKVSFQYAAEESEHRLLANYATGARPPNDLAFAPMLYNSASEIIAELEALGIIGGTGPSATYPGPGTIDPTNVTNRTPDGPVVSCLLPNAGGVVLTAQLTPLVGSDAFGFAKLTVNARLGQVCAQISVARVNVSTTAQIRAGGAVVSTLSIPSMDGLSSGCVLLDAAIAQAIIANPGNYSVVITSGDNPDGVLQGHLMPL
ncbi:MAG: CHRD domain-containing protein [Chloroflexota bacterium]|nr:CHRD domain-containing protein [Chloroflexota bacterium]